MYLYTDFATVSSTKFIVVSRLKYRWKCQIIKLIFFSFLFYCLWFTCRQSWKNEFINFRNCNVMRVWILVISTTLYATFEVISSQKEVTDIRSCTLYCLNQFQKLLLTKKHQILISYQHLLYFCILYLVTFASRWSL